MNIRKIGFMLMLGVVCLLVLIAPVSAQDSAHELLFSDGTIHKVDIDSGVVTQLSDSDWIAASPAWSPDGTQISFIQTPGGDCCGQYSLFIMDTDGGKLVQLADDLVWRSEPVWFANGDALLYATSSDVKGGDCIIKSVKRDGSEPHEIFRHPQKNCDASSIYPVLSPDNTHIVFAVDEQDNGKYFELDEMDVASGKMTALTHNRAANSSPQWSPDGTQIAFVTNQDGQQEIYVIAADGNDVRRLTHRPGHDYVPRWLLDGKHLIFESHQRDFNIYSLDVSSGTVRNLTNLTDSSAWDGTLSPDGKQIAYFTGIDPVSGANHIDIMTLDTGEVQELKGVGASAYMFGMATIGEIENEVDAMNPTVEPYLEQVKRWPKSGRHILAQYDVDSVVVYQAYRPDIGQFAASHGYFGGHFQLGRMSWIKPNFLWMMFRCGWATKENQESVLAVTITRDGFNTILGQAVHSRPVPNVYGSVANWKQALATSQVRLQWDPDHDPVGNKMERRAIQLGLRGDVLRKYAKDWVVNIEDITPFVREQHQLVLAQYYDDLLTPCETVYPVHDADVAARLEVS